jgi:hypothetical protein
MVQYPVEGDWWSHVPGGETSSLVVETSGLAVPEGETSSLVVETTGLTVPERETSSLVVEMSNLIEERGGW